jgi:hypothetical protein
MNFAIFICSHGRPNVLTVDALRGSGYTGGIVIVVDDEDDTVPQYYENYQGKDSIYIRQFCKQDYIDRVDTGSQKCNAKRATILYAKCFCEDLAREHGLDAFGIADDDFTGFRFRYLESDKMKSQLVHFSLDNVFNLYSKFIIENNMCMTSLATNQMFMGGMPKIEDYRIPFSFVIRNVSIPFEWQSDIFEDIISETLKSKVGYFMMQMPFVQLNLLPLYAGASGGMTEVYQSENFIGKLFPIIQHLPSCTKIVPGIKRPTTKLMKDKAFPKLISGSFKKQLN